MQDQCLHTSLYPCTHGHRPKVHPKSTRPLARPVLAAGGFQEGDVRPELLSVAFYSPAKSEQLLVVNTENQAKLKFSGCKSLTSYGKPKAKVDYLTKSFKVLTSTKLSWLLFLQTVKQNVKQLFRSQGKMLSPWPNCSAPAPRPRDAPNARLEGAAPLQRLLQAQRGAGVRARHDASGAGASQGRARGGGDGAGGEWGGEQP